MNNGRRDTERFRAEDERIACKNELQNYCINLKSTVEKGGLRFSEADKMFILNQCNEMIEWLDANPMASKDEFESQKKEIERVCNPLITHQNQVNKKRSWFSWLGCRP